MCQRDVARSALPRVAGAIDTARQYGYRQEVEDYTRDRESLLREDCP